MLASNLELVRHILTETAFIIQHTDNKTKEQVIDDEVLCRAVVSSIGMWLITIPQIISSDTESYSCIILFLVSTIFLAFEILIASYFVKIQSIVNKSFHFI